MNPLRVFVYGTLKPGEVNYQRYCVGKALEEVRAIAFGQLFDLPCGYPAMTPGDKPVQGYLLTFADPAILKLLDELEDYDSQRMSAENEYYREQIEVYNLAGQTLGHAWVYLMTFEQVQQWGGILMSTGWWSRDLHTLSSY